jgi:hypothetical protein
MASKTTKTWYRRDNRAKNMGLPRKALLRRGTTPAFPIHTPESHKNAPKEQLPKGE